MTSYMFLGLTHTHLNMWYFTLIMYIFLFVFLIMFISLPDEVSDVLVMPL